MMFDETTVMYVSTKGATNARAAFDRLESKLPSLKGRKFYGYFDPETEEYRACAAVIEGDRDPEALDLAKWIIPKGKYLYEKIYHWNRKTDLIAPTFQRLIKENSGIIDFSRPLLEYYKSSRELRLLIPVSS